MDTTPIFDNISNQYSALNHIFSLGIDNLWRKEAVRYIVRNMQREKKEEKTKVLDVACGTGDLTVLLAKKGLFVSGIDLSSKMLEIAKQRCAKYGERVELRQTDASNLDADLNGFDFISIAYGIRNFDKRHEALKEFARVLNSGGKLVILEFGEPTGRFLRWGYNLYFKKLMPLMAKIFSLGKFSWEYKYFVNSVERFPKFEAFCKEIEAAGFQDVTFKKQSGGISVLYTATKG